MFSLSEDTSISLKDLDEGCMCPGGQGCRGTLGYEPNGDCHCGQPGASPPCWACTNSILACDNCGWEEGDNVFDGMDWVELT